MCIRDRVIWYMWAESSSHHASVLCCTRHIMVAADSCSFYRHSTHPAAAAVTCVAALPLLGWCTHSCELRQHGVGLQTEVNPLPPDAFTLLWPQTGQTPNTFFVWTVRTCCNYVKNSPIPAKYQAFFNEILISIQSMYRQNTVSSVVLHSVIQLEAWYRASSASQIKWH